LVVTVAPIEDGAGVTLTAPVTVPLVEAGRSNGVVDRLTAVTVSVVTTTLLMISVVSQGAVTIRV
jgi:hypothetical protein